MAVDISNLTIERLIIHEVFKRGPGQARIEPVYSDDLVALAQDGLDAMRDRMVQALGDDSHSLEMMISNDAPDHTFQVAARLLDLGDQGEFVRTSRRLADLLADAQVTRTIPGGIVVVVTGRLGASSKRYIAIVKAETHSGFTRRKADGGRVLVQFLRDLFLTPQQTLYKIGLYVEDASPTQVGNLRSPADFSAQVYDHQMGRNETRLVAFYFYNTFLGCDYAPTAKKLTQEFYVHTREFIDTLDILPEDKMDLGTGLYTYLKLSNQATVRVAEFANTYLDAETSDAYRTFMTARGFPQTAVAKDLEYLRNRLRRRKLMFTSGVRLNAPSDQFSDLVTVVGQEEEHTMLRIKGTISQEQ